MTFSLCHIASRSFAAICLGAVVFAQAPNANDLLADEWRVRNTTALQLLKHKDTRNEDLLRVLQTPWNGHVPHRGASGAGRTRATDPREQTLRSAGREIGYNWPITAPRRPQHAGELVGPWHPHKLATLLLIERATNRGLQELQPTDTNRARIWLACCQPTEEQIATALASTETAEAVLYAVLATASDRQQRVLKLIVDGPAPARRAAFRMVGDAPLDSAHLLAAIEQLLNADDEAYTRNAAHHLVRSGAPAAKALAKHLGKDRSDRQRALALLCTMDEHAKPAAAELIACLKYDVTSQRRALVALANFPVPASLQQLAASKIFALLEKTRSRIVRVLAADALASCGAGVTDAQRTRLHAILQDRKFVNAHSRLLASLRKLDAMPDLALDDLAKLAKSINATADSWVTLADHGEAAGPLIVKHKLFDPIVATRLAETAPNMLVTWLNDEQAGPQETALVGLLAKRPDLVDSKQLTVLLAKESKLANLAFDSLCQRPNASQHVPQLLEFIRKRGYVWAKHAQAIRKLEPSFATLVDTLKAQLRIGKMWNVVRGRNDDELRQLGMQWLAETEDGGVRDKLLAEIVKLGLQKGREIQLVEQALRGKDHSDVLSALSTADSVPAQLIPALEAVCDLEPEHDWWSRDWEARESLITAHR